MELIDKIRLPYKLKEIERSPYVNGRYESDAEHVFSSIVLAQYFLKEAPGINELKVIKMILYHDYPEIFVGDTDLLDTENRKEKEKKETRTLEQLEKSLPRGVGKDVIQLYTEYKERKTIEAKFVKAIDCLDPMLQSMTSKKEWAEKGYTEENIRAHKEKYLSEFPEMMKLFNQIIEHLLENKIIQEK